jgi:hypothetical protein
MQFDIEIYTKTYRPNLISVQYYSTNQTVSVFSKTAHRTKKTGSSHISYYSQQLLFEHLNNSYLTKYRHKKT